MVKPLKESPMSNAMAGATKDASALLQQAHNDTFANDMDQELCRIFGHNFGDEESGYSSDEGEVRPRSRPRWIELPLSTSALGFISPTSCSARSTSPPERRQLHPNLKRCRSPVVLRTPYNSAGAVSPSSILLTSASRQSPLTEHRRKTTLISSPSPYSPESCVTKTPTFKRSRSRSRSQTAALEVNLSADLWAALQAMTEAMVFGESGKRGCNDSDDMGRLRALTPSLLPESNLQCEGEKYESYPEPVVLFKAAPKEGDVPLLPRPAADRVQGEALQPRVVQPPTAVETGGLSEGREAYNPPSVADGHAKKVKSTLSAKGATFVPKQASLGPPPPQHQAEPHLRVPPTPPPYQGDTTFPPPAAALQTFPPVPLRPSHLPRPTAEHYQAEEAAREGYLSHQESFGQGPEGYAHHPRGAPLQPSLHAGMPPGTLPPAPPPHQAYARAAMADEGTGMQGPAMSMGTQPLPPHHAFLQGLPPHMQHAPPAQMHAVEAAAAAAVGAMMLQQQHFLHHHQQQQQQQHFLRHHPQQQQQQHQQGQQHHGGFAQVPVPPHMVPPQVAQQMMYQGVPVPVPSGFEISQPHLQQPSMYFAPPPHQSGSGVSASAPSGNFEKRDSRDSNTAASNSGEDSSDTLTPAARNRFKETFVKEFRAHERDMGYKHAKRFALRKLRQCPQSYHWMIYIEIAEMAKRENRIDEARKYYRRINQLMPTAGQAWLEYAKMEEECGELENCQRILVLGLAHCPLNEQLMVKGIRHEERMGNLPAARAMLARLKTVQLDKTWRTVLEGGLLEARAGNIHVGRKIFKYLIKNVPWHGPIYFDAFRAEEKAGDYERALEIVERGLKEIPRYGPLWFGLMRLHERKGGGDLSLARDAARRAVGRISKELVWKVHFEEAQMEERAGGEGALGRARKAYVRAVKSCPDNLVWKVWLGGARTEAAAGNVKEARMLLDRAMACVPRKMRATVLLEASRLEEFVGDLARARKILRKARREAGNEWKVHLEAVLLEARQGDAAAAVTLAEEALAVHPGTGRLWAALIQLKQDEGEDEQLRVFRQALTEVPKSGEVWTEGARVYMKPLSARFSLADARRALDFAIQFTPQYGDSFIEYLRLEMLDRGPESQCAKIELACVNADPNYGALWFYCKEHPLYTTRQVLQTARERLLEDIRANAEVYQRTITQSQCLRARKVNDTAVNEVRARYRPADFATGLIALNRMSRDTAALSKEERFKLIYGSDSVVS